MDCLGTDCMPGFPGNCIHYQFIQHTDKRSVMFRIDSVVKKAMQAKRENLERKREKLRAMLDAEEHHYHLEYAENFMARSQIDIERRKQKLMEKHDVNLAQTQKYLQLKQVQSSMINCVEIRDALRKKETMETKAIQREQMVEKERSIARERQMDLNWYKIQKAEMDRYDEQQIKENCLRKHFKEQIKFTLGKQIEEQNARKALEQKEKQAEIERINKLIEELRLEEFDRKNNPVRPSTAEYRDELLAMMEERRCAREREFEEAAEEHRELMRAIQREEAEANSRVIAAKKAHNRALLEFIAFVKNTHRLQAEIDKRRDDQIEMVRRIDVCTKSSLTQKMRLKAKETARYYAELRLQICEQYERRRLEELERREDKMLENPFGRSEKSRSEVLAEKRAMRHALEEQIESLRKYRAEEAKKYESSLMKATDDPELCRELAVKYLSEGIDYLKPHTNWSILLDPCKKYEPKKPMANVEVPAKLIPSLGTCSDTCIRPCGCMLRPYYDSGKSQIAYKGEAFKGIKTKCQPKLEKIAAFIESGYQFEYE